MKRTQSAIALLAMSAALLSGCSSDNLAFDLSSEETVGMWAVPDSTIRVELDTDGTLTAGHWPSNLYCSGNAAATLEDLNHAETVDFAGSWAALGSGFPYQLSLQFPPDLCPTGGGPVTIWRGPDDKLAMCIIIPPHSDPDAVLPGQLLVLEKEESTGSITSATCG